MIKFLNNFSVIHLIFLALIIRILAYIFFSDTELVHEWARIIHNFEVTGVFGIYVVENDFLANPKSAETGEKVLPSVFMPPLYYYFIFLIKYFANGLINFIDLIIIIQILISLVSIYIFYRILKLFAEKELTICITLIFALFPINVLSATQISSITLQIFLILCFFFCLIRFQTEKKLVFLILFSFFSGLLMYIRGEFFLFYFLTLIYFSIYLKKDFKNIIVSLIITLLTISPYLKRNFNLFETITLTKSSGYNLLKGNNPQFKIEGNAAFIETEFPREKLNFKADNKYEIKLDNFYKQKAFEYIKSDPLKYLYFYFLKIMSFIFLDFTSTAVNYFNIFHLFPKIVVSILSLFGAIISLKKKGFFQFLALYYFANILLFSAFFILPRYSLILLPIQLLLSIKLIKFLQRKLRN